MAQIPPMFQPQPNQSDRVFRFAVIGLLTLSVTALAITIWTMIDFWREQAIVNRLIDDLPANSRDSAVFLAGELRWQFRLTTLVVLNVVATAIALVLLFRAYRQSQSSLRDIRALASDIVGSMEQAVLTTDLNGNLTSINRRGIGLFSTSHQAVGSLVDDVCGLPLDGYRRAWMENRTEPAPKEFTFSKEDSSRTLRVFCQMLTDSRGDEIGNVLQVRDVTESRLIEQRVQRMERYMGLGPLAVGLHHEIKNPLAALSLHFQLLEEQLEADGGGEENRETLDVVRSELSRIGRVLESFRDFASIDRLEVSAVSLNKLVDQQLSLIRPQASAQNVQIAFTPDQSLQEIPIDRGRIEQTLLNLLLNAMESMPGGGKLTVRTAEQHQTLVIEVTDTGPGIPEEIRDKILDPYFTTKNGGTGLGLAISDKIMREHAGVLEFESSADGTTFRMNFSRTPIHE